MSKLDQLKEYTVIVADTGELEAIKKYKPQDATTNPSLVLKAIQGNHYDDLIHRSMKAAEHFDDGIDRLLTAIGAEILQEVPGYVSTEVDARLSFNTEATLAKARRLIELYEADGWSRDRILIKIASTWEGIQAAKVLQQEGINCNMTLLFGMEQAQACADAGATLISPFVGRILDWYKKDTGKEYTAEDDPGVVSVRAIYDHYKSHGYKTIVMGASFRNAGEIEALAGCDRLTISPALLEELSQDNGELKRVLHAPDALGHQAEPISENDFRLGMNNNAMATEKLAEGIRKFIEDQVKMEELIKSHLA
ncbi:transaldolase [Saccharospirillum salsuginis]|uniref:Transaldolase n=1 Tax=Saccharospirillum salsuginis TaxID=418750 RepID=A0A918N9A7_9GAMM|nr:transaldolase [Saccharospirillum salsuginis]GGX51223.1 transaldolase [Saccharospirillum salsuginis]